VTWIQAESRRLSLVARREQNLDVNAVGSASGQAHGKGVSCLRSSPMLKTRARLDGEAWKDADRSDAFMMRTMLLDPANGPQLTGAGERERTSLA
jgi:hypothetical protein